MTRRERIIPVLHVMFRHPAGIPFHRSK